MKDCNLLPGFSGVHNHFRKFIRVDASSHDSILPAVLKVILQEVVEEGEVVADANS